MSKGKKNAYICAKCGFSTVTVDVDEGATPSSIICRNPRKCEGLAQSQFYNIDQASHARWEWYRPSAEIVALSPPQMRTYFEKSGLAMRPKPVRDANVARKDQHRSRRARRRARA